MTIINLFQVFLIGLTFTIINLLFPSILAFLFAPVAAALAASVWTYSVVERNRTNKE